MILPQILPFAHELLARALEFGGIAIDATMGNGNDTLQLARLVGANGHVFAFDVQAQALVKTQQRLQTASLDQRVTLYLHGHEQLAAILPKAVHGHIQAAIFNLGYLPGSDQHIVTTPKTTIAALTQLLPLLAPRGLVVLVVYQGHPAGAHERDALLDFSHNLSAADYRVLHYQFLHTSAQAPFIIAIERKATA